MILELQHRRPDGDVDTYHLKPGRRYHMGRGSNCEVRILDLKLSRKHAAIEFLDGSWKLIDLCSTNGCRLNGETMVGTIDLAVGSQIEIGQTTLVIQRIGDAGGAQVKEPSSGYQSDEFSPQDPSAQQAPHKALDQREPTPPPPVYQAEKYASSESFSPANIHGADDPKRAIAITPVAPAPVLREASKAVPVLPDSPTPARGPAAVRRGAPVRPVTLQADPSLSLEDTVATVAPASAPPPFVKPAAPTPLPVQQSAPASIAATATATPAPGEDRTYFITVLGRRIGPLSRAVARDLKARELKGTLRPGDLDAYPQA